MKIYLSGPVSLGGELTPDQIGENVRRFQETAEDLQDQGHEVIDPTNMGIDEYQPWPVKMRTALRGLLDCDAIFMLPGWHHSLGALVELQIACLLRMHVMYHRDVTPRGLPTIPCEPAGKRGRALEG